MYDAAKAETTGSEPPTRGAGARRTKWWYFKWTVRATVVLLAVGYVVFVGFDGKFYYPDRDGYERPETFRLAYEDVHFRTKDGLTLHGWFFPAAAAKVRGTVVHFHGNAANIGAHLGLVWWLPAQGYNLLMFDYRGYGESEGRVSRAGTIADGHAALDYALRRPDVQGRPLFVYGQSLGGAVGIVVAAQRPEVAAVVAESPFSGYRRIAARHVARLVKWDWLARGIAVLTVSAGYDPIDVVGRLSPRPLLIVVAGADQICFPESGRELFEAAGEPKEFWLAPEAEHLGILSDYDEELRERVVGLFERAAHGR
jgi:fermentation-respiration switch protein FrsA (DUF1100 family)